MQQVKKEQINGLLSFVDSKHHNEITLLLENILNEQSNELVDKVENIATNLHKTLESFGSDSMLIKHTKLDLPDASERLEYVIEATKEASEKTLSSSENILAIIESMQDNLSDANVELLQQVKSEVIEIITAQSFQDLTGQVLNRIIILVGTIEQSLYELIASSGINIETICFEQKEEDRLKEEARGMGPNITKSNSAGSKDDVDDLLDSLGI